MSRDIERITEQYSKVIQVLGEKILDLEDEVERLSGDWDELQKNNLSLTEANETLRSANYQLKEEIKTLNDYKKS